MKTAVKVIELESSDKIKHQEDLKKRAIEAIKDQKDLAKLTSKLNDHKVFFRKEANGKLFNLEVAGKGKITVATKGIGSSYDAVQFDEEAYNKLSDAAKKKLKEQGVVKDVTITKTPGEPAVTIKVNV